MFTNCGEVFSCISNSINDRKDWEGVNGQGDPVFIPKQDNTYHGLLFFDVNKMKEGVATILYKDTEQ